MPSHDIHELLPQNLVAILNIVTLLTGYQSYQTELD